MEQQKRGCCIAGYAGGAYYMSKVDRIMLRFRPIAPKPVFTDGSISGGRSTGSGAVTVKAGRGKTRKSDRDRCSNSTVRKRNGRKGIRKSSPENTDSGMSVTGKETDFKALSLLLEEPNAREGPTIAAPMRGYPLWLNFGKEGSGAGTATPAADRSDMWETAALVRRRVGVVQSWVKVECVTDTWTSAAGCYGYGGMGRTDQERVMDLHQDTCPGLISDGENRVRWTNAAYRRMVAAGEEEAAACVVVEQGVVVPVGCAGFTCRVRVVTCGRKDKGAKTVPCDVWRMDCGGFAWRLDTAAALSLGFGDH